MAKESSLGKVKQVYEKGIEHALEGKSSNPYRESTLGVFLKLGTGAVLFDNDEERRKKEAAYDTGNKDGQAMRKKS